MNPTKLISWNVNGFRAILKKNFMEFFHVYAPNILCLQEIKAYPEQVALDLPKGYRIYWNSAEKRGYSGTAVITNKPPLSVSNGINIKNHDTEGRVITLEYPKYFLVNVYTPNSGSELKRLDYRQQWDKDFVKYVKKLEKKKPVVVCGDLNVAHTEIDLANPDQNHMSAGFTDEERAGFSRFLSQDFIDTFREVNKEPNHYTWWSYRARAREKNVGWRIDYFCISKGFRPQMKSVHIYPEVLGSDHCPVGLILK